MKKLCCKVLLLFVLGVALSGVTAFSDLSEKSYYPDTQIITFESVTGVELIESKINGDKITYVYPYIGSDSGDENWSDKFYANYNVKLENGEGWTKVEENISVGEHVFSRNGYVVQINADTENKRVYITVFKDKEGKYEVIDNSIITVYINGERIYFDVAPQLINDRTMVPMRAIFEALDCDVQWDEKNQLITAKKEVDDEITEIEMQIDRNSMKVDEEEKILDVAPTLVEGRTLVPVRAISEALGVNVEWHDPIQTVDIYIKKADTIVLYNNENVANSPNYLVKKYTKSGWTTTKPKKYVTMYTEDGRTESFEDSRVEAQKSVGWYTEPVQRLYAPGKSQVFKKSEVAAQLTVGWYEEPVVVKATGVEKMAEAGTSTRPDYSSFINTSTVTAKLYGTSVLIHNKGKYPIKITSILIDELSHMYGSQKNYEITIAPGELRDLHFACYRSGCEKMIHGTASQARLSVKFIRDNAFSPEAFLYFDVNGIFRIFY